MSLLAPGASVQACKMQCFSFTLTQTVTIGGPVPSGPLARSQPSLGRTNRPSETSVLPVIRPYP
jgi:hypothetical protein